MVEDALEVGRVLPGDLLLHLTSSLLLPALEVPLQDDQSLCVSAFRKILYWSHSVERSHQKKQSDLPRMFSKSFLVYRTGQPDRAWGVHTTSEYFKDDNFEENLSKTRREISFLFFKIGRHALRHSMRESRPYQNIAQILFTKAKERHSIQTLDSEWVPSRVAELGSLSSGAKMAMKIFVKRVFTIFTSNASFLRVISNLQN